MVSIAAIAMLVYQEYSNLCLKLPKWWISYPCRDRDQNFLVVMVNSSIGWNSPYHKWFPKFMNYRCIHQKPYIIPSYVNQLRLRIGETTLGLCPNNENLPKPKLQLGLWGMMRRRHAGGMLSMWVKQCHFYHTWLGLVKLPPMSGDLRDGLLVFYPQYFY